MQRRQLGPARFDWSEQFILDLLLDRLQPTSARLARLSRCSTSLSSCWTRSSEARSCTESLCAMGHGSLDILLTESGGLLEHGYQSVPHIIYCVAFIALRILCRGATSALQMFLAIADPSGDSSEYGGIPAVASRDEVKMSIPLLSAAHESGEFGVETWRVLEERRMTDALIDRELGARDHFRRVLGSDEVRVLVLGPVGH